MITIMYLIEKYNSACLAISFDENGNIKNSKIKTGTNSSEYAPPSDWDWIDYPGFNHVFVGKDEVEDKLIPYVKVLHEALDSDSNVLPERKRYAEPHKNELAYILGMVKNFVSMREDPASVYEFEEFKIFKQKFNLPEEYLVEDLLIEMEEISQEIDEKGV